MITDSTTLKKSTPKSAMKLRQTGFEFPSTFVILRSQMTLLRGEARHQRKGNVSVFHISLTSFPTALMWYLFLYCKNNYSLVDIQIFPKKFLPIIKQQMRANMAIHNSMLQRYFDYLIDAMRNIGNFTLLLCNI